MVEVKTILEASENVAPVAKVDDALAWFWAPATQKELKTVESMNFDLNNYSEELLEVSESQYGIWKDSSIVRKPIEEAKEEIVNLANITDSDGPVAENMFDRLPTDIKKKVVEEYIEMWGDISDKTAKEVKEAYFKRKGKDITGKPIEKAPAWTKIKDNPERALANAEANYEKYVSDYRSKLIKEGKNPNYINPDDFRTYVDEGNMQAPDTHDAASYLAERYFDDVLKKNKNKKALLIWGGPGSGKWSALQIFDDKDFGIVIDKVSWSDELEKLVDAGYDATYNFVYREVESALEEGVLPRAIRWNIKDWLGKGRTVPQSITLKGHAKSRKFINEAISDPKYDEVIFSMTDNTGKIWEEKLLNSDELRGMMDTIGADLKKASPENMIKKAQEALKSKTITSAQYKSLIASMVPILIVGGGYAYATNGA